jgi:hypothetical protein
MLVDTLCMRTKFKRSLIFTLTEKSHEQRYLL